jgi:ATP-dependent RNA helicase HelY
VVLDAGVSGFAEPRPLVVTEDRWAGRLAAGEFGAPVDVLGRIRLPKHVNHRSPGERRDIAASIANLGLDRVRSGRRTRSQSPSGEDKELERLRHAMRKHPCHACPEREDHARWAERRHRLERDTDAMREKVASRTGSLARTFDRVCDLLTARGYLTGDTDAGVTDAGRMLARIWTEADLLVAEALRQGVFDGLGPAELAATVSTVVYEARRETEDRASLPRGPVTDAVEGILRVYGDIIGEERDRGLPLSREPDLGFVWPIYRWARGEPLAKVLASSNAVDGELPAGDFVRWARQVVDLHGQIAEAKGTPEDVRATARQSMDLINRGVLAYTSVG